MTAVTRPGRLPSVRRGDAPRGPRWARPIIHLVIVLFMIVWFTPIVGILATAIRTQADTAATGWWRLFVDPLITMFNFQQAFSIIGVGQSIGTSLAISVPVTVLTTLISVIGAYALTRMRFAGRTALSLLLVAMLVVPPQVTLVPMLQFFNAVGLSGSVPAIWIY